MMRKPMLFFLVAAVVVLLGAALYLTQNLRQSRADFAALQADEQATSARYAAAIEEVAAIQESLQAIDVGAEGAQELETQLAEEKSLTADRGEEAMIRIGAIKAGVERANIRIGELEEQLNQSDVKVAGLEKMIRALRQSVTEREAQIVQLTNRVAELQTQVTGLETEVQVGQETIRSQTETIQTQTEALEDSRRRLSTVYYVVGTKDELTKADLIESKGGVLGFRKSQRPTGRTEGGTFTAVDTDRVTVIRIAARKARLISAQPASSYILEQVGDQLELWITDSEAFRAIKYVIIMTD